jgi:hypothetical protein
VLESVFAVALLVPFLLLSGAGGYLLYRMLRVQG